MAIKQNHICVFDFEADGKDPRFCSPVQLSAKMLRHVDLEEIPNSQFNVLIRPPDIDDEDYYEKNKDTIEWHAKNHDKDPQEIFEDWKTYIDQKTAFKSWTEYLLQYNINPKKKNFFGAPIAAGSNIRKFDLILMHRLCEKHGKLNARGEINLFFPRDVLDTQDLAFYWFENHLEPEKYNIDDLRAFFGMPLVGGHEAMKDVEDSAWILRKLLMLNRRCSELVKNNDRPFKGAYAREKADSVSA